MIDHVRSIIIEYLGGRFATDGLRSRLPDPWELDEANADDDLRDLTMRIVGYLAEHEAGDRTEDELRVALNDILAGPPEAVAGAMKVDVEQWAEPNQRAGTALQAEYA